LSDWTPQIVRVEKIEKHPGADRLIIVTVLGDYPIITNMVDLKVGDLIGYLPIDTIVPDTDDFYFLCPMAYEKYEDEEGNVQQRQTGPKFPVGSVPEKHRILKAKKIRGVYSQGMLHPINPCLNPSVIMVEGDSLVELLGLKKWDEPEEENLPGLKKTGTNAEKPPQGWVIPHYDIDGLRKYISCLQENEEIVLTEKIHGSNSAFCHDGARLWVKSRNYFKRMDEDDMWWDVALRNDFETKMVKYPMMVFFGELYGQVKGYRYDTVIEGGRLLTKVRFFDVFNAKTGRYLDYDERVQMMDSIGLDRVPELYRGPWNGKEEMYPYAEGPSTLNPKHLREGFVLNTAIERFEPRLQSRMQVKLVGEGYNLKK
jgi:RNA ligase (TIGR02306 family)